MPASRTPTWALAVGRDDGEPEEVVAAHGLQVVVVELGDGGAAGGELELYQCLAVAKPCVEVHLSDVDNREGDFRKISVIRDSV